MSNDTNKFIIDVARIVEREKPIMASRMIHAIYDGLFEDKPNVIECAKGCSFCCNNSVHITETEVKELAHSIRKTYGKKEMSTLKDSLKHIQKKYQKMNRADRMLDRTPCPLLVDGSCSAYESRPLFCRSAFSYSKKACEMAQEDGNMYVPMEGGAKAMAEDMHVGILLGERKKEEELTIVEGLLKEMKW